ncbi:porin [Thiomicrospira sp.]|uniref:porin n=1 Tax=Thiomicrospira sp. TaxID=935 RepID=UPI002F92911B
MKKNILAIAIASAVAAPVAMANGPTVYGQMQVEIANVDNGGYGDNNFKGQRQAVTADESALKMADNKRGRLGIKGSEDLGNGLQAIYQFEWQIDTPNGNIADGARIGMVGLKGGFGTFEAGRLKVPYKYTGGVKYDPFACTYLEARNSGGMSGGAFGHNSFWDNSVAYKNDFGKVNVWVAYGVDGGNGDTDTGNSGDLSASVTYKDGNYEAFVSTAMDVDTSGEGTGTTPAAAKADNDLKYTANKVGGQYKMGNHTFSAQYEMITNEGTTASPRPNDDASTVAFLGYQLKMGATTLVAQLGQTDDDADARDTDYMAVGAIHKLSKKTRVFGGYRNSDQADGKGDYTAITAGLRIDF